MAIGTIQIEDRAYTIGIDFPGDRDRIRRWSQFDVLLNVSGAYVIKHPFDANREATSDERTAAGF